MYERLRSRKREGESFTEVVDRLLDEAKPDWRAGLGTLSHEERVELERLIEEERTELGRGLANRQEQVLDAMTDESTADETP